VHTPLHGFTLIELLVVIAIIGLLLSIVVPALQKAKEYSKLTVCLSSHRGLVMAWHTYSTDNDDRLVNGHTVRGGTLEDSIFSWVEPPVTGTRGSSVYTGENNPVLLEDELNGIRHGVLFPYLEIFDVYHCPSDNRPKYTGFAKPPAFRSYSIISPMNGEFRAHSVDVYVTKKTQIRVPTERFVFMDDFDNRGWNMGSWVFNHRGREFEDPIAYWHDKQCNFSYADGHAARRKWVDPRTVQFARQYIGEARDISRSFASQNNADVDFLYRGMSLR